ncbi:recombinase family protein [Brevibacterium aurantiacum]|uniref:Site-specific DNA recombinase n=1 Tax=Brevibacterium aurantiacum TaxID=273384 RepID=A0A2H1JF73_BREAU|nr:recombinase family protein [Brevibacterium aurantiacum]SMX86140.1 Site-specific DNA recombinase [Brevibacterium aurantiacum]
MNSEPRRAAIYLRISQDRENTRLGVDRHREDAEALMKARGWRAAGLYEDNDISGVGKQKRPAFERLLADIERGLVNVVVAQEWPRLERNRVDGVRIIEAAQRHEILLTFAKGSDIDCTTAAGRLSADLFSAIARNEIEVKAERQSRAQRQRAEQGRAPKGVRPLGYTIQGEVIPHEASAVEAIYEAFAAGASLRAIAAALSGETGPDVPVAPPLPRHTRTLAQERNEKRASDGLPPRPVPDDGPWPPSTVLGILRNPRYAAYSTYTPSTMQPDGGKRRSWRATILRTDSGEPVRSQWAPLVSEATWWAVQDRLDDPKRVTNRVGTDRRHLGSGLYLCGWRDPESDEMCELPVRAHSQRYRCEGHVMRKREHIDTYVVETVRARLARPDLRDVMPTSDHPRLRVVADEVTKHRGRIARAQADYDGEIIEGRDLKRIREKAEVSISALEAERARLSLGSGAIAILHAPNPVQAFDNADLATKRAVINALCTVHIHPHPRGRKGFNPATVTITPRRAHET